MVLKVLLADPDQMRGQALERELIRSLSAVVIRLDGLEGISEAVAAHAPDVVILDAALPDRDALEDVRAVAARFPRPIVMFVDRDDPSFMEDAIEAGVSSYNVVGSAVPDVKPIVQAAVAMFRRHQRIEEDLRRARSSLEERRVVERAKALLMQQRKTTEPEAYHWLRREAMDKGRRIVDLASEILAREEERKTMAKGGKPGEKHFCDRSGS